MQAVIGYLRVSTQEQGKSGLGLGAQRRAIETFAGHPGLEQTARLEENVLVTGKGPVVFTLMEHMEEAMKK